MSLSLSPLVRFSTSTWKKKMGQATFRVGSGDILVYGVWMRGRVWLQSLLASLLSRRVVVGLGAYAKYGS